MRESVDSPDPGAPCARPCSNASTSSAWARPRPRWSCADREPLDVPLGELPGRPVRGHHQHRGADDVAGRIGDDPQHPGLVAGPAARSRPGSPRTAPARAPTTRGRRPRRRSRPNFVVVRGRRADGVPRRQVAVRHRGALRAAGGPSWSSAGRSRASPAAGRRPSPRRDGPADLGVALCSRAAPSSQPARAVPMPRRRYAGSTPASPRPAPISSPNATRALRVVHPHRHGREVEARPLPVGLEVGGLDVDAAEVVLLLGGGHGEDRVAGPRR